MNKITETQLESTQLKRLAAQRQLYSDAKAVQAVQVGLSILSPPILAFLVFYCFLPRALAALFGIIITGILSSFDRRQQSLKGKAAEIQELFDCKVLEMEWREFMIDSRPEIETVEKYASKHRRKDPNYFKLKNWYSEKVGELPLHLGRIVCQRLNCWWDAQLRRRYTKWVISSVTVLTVIVAYIGFIDGFSFEKLILTVINPLMPAFVLGKKQFTAHKESATQLDKLKKHAEELWDTALVGTSPEELTSKSRELQDEIYQNRRTNPLIFDWLYNLLRNKDEELMNKTVDELVKEALESLQK